MCCDILFFFFKQKTAYEIYQCDWSSDVCSSDLDMLNRVRQPFNVNSLAQSAAVAALEDEDHLHESVRSNQAGMRQLVDGIQALNLSYIPSVGNFLAVDIGRDPGEVYEALLREGVIVRPVDNYGLPGYLRISIGLPEENQRFLQALDKVLAA